MSIIQTIIGSAVGVNYNPTLTYPAPGSNYPITRSNIASFSSQSQPAYYEASSIITPVTGLWRRTYGSTAITGSSFDTNFPSGYGQTESMRDEHVGFGSADDSATNYSMEWKGYFKPAVSGDFNFAFQVDDYLCFWIGANAVSGSTWVNANAAGANDLVAGKFPLVAGRYYPVRIAYTENFGGNQCTVWAGLDGTVPVHNTANAAVGQFFFDDTDDAHRISFPGLGLVTP